MNKFRKNDTAELKKTLYYSDVHDTELTQICTMQDGQIKIETYNPICNKNIDFLFYDVKVFIAIKGAWGGSRTTVIAATVEEDLSYVKPFLLNYEDAKEHDLYMIFQMLSGDELHIVASEVTVE